MYLDYVAPRVGQLAVLAAVHHARRTGEGQHLDLSQMEAAMQFLGPALVDRQMSGAEPARRGNADPEMFPHGVYACRGCAEARTAGTDDAPYWVAIACRGEDDWRRLCTATGGTLDAHLDLEQRRARGDEIDREIALLVLDSRGGDG